MKQVLILNFALLLICLLLESVQCQPKSISADVIDADNDADNDTDVGSFLQTVPLCHKESHSADTNDDEHAAVLNSGGNVQRDFHSHTNSQHQQFHSNRLSHTARQFNSNHFLFPSGWIKQHNTLDQCLNICFRLYKTQPPNGSAVTERQHLKKNLKNKKTITAVKLQSAATATAVRHDELKAVRHSNRTPALPDYWIMLSPSLRPTLAEYKQLFSGWKRSEHKSYPSDEQENRAFEQFKKCVDRITFMLKKKPSEIKECYADRDMNELLNELYRQYFKEIGKEKEYDPSKHTISLQSLWKEFKQFYRRNYHSVEKETLPFAWYQNTMDLSICVDIAGPKRFNPTAMMGPGADME